MRSIGVLHELSSLQDSIGLDLLMWAARGGDESSIFLAGEVCKGSGVDSWGGNALHHWAEVMGSGLGSGSQILLAFGVDPCGRDILGLMPMHWGKTQGVWAWSMAALWARGKSESWRKCNQLSCASVAILLFNLRLQT